MLLLEICRKEWTAFLKSKVLLVEILFIYAFVGLFPGLVLYGLSIRQELDLVKTIAMLEFIKSSIIFLPSICAATLAADIFAGEKERKTLETLFALPLSETELYLGKIMAVFLPIYGLGVIVFMISTIVIKRILTTMVFVLKFPNLEWFLIGLLLTLIFILLTIGFTVLISVHVGTVREASLSVVVVVIPLIALILGQLFFNVQIDVDFIIKVSLGSSIVSLGLLLFGLSRYRRDLLITLH